MLYCDEHLALATDWSDGGTGVGQRGRPARVCPNCHPTVPTRTGVCGDCGERVTNR